MLEPRTLIISAEFPPGPGGIGTHAYQLALQLGTRGWDVSVATPQELATDAEIAAFRVPFPLHRLAQPPGAPTKLAYRAAVVTQLLLRSRPSLIIATGERMVWLAAMLAPVHRIPYAAIGHAQEFNVPARWQRTLNRTAFERARGVVCVSRYTDARMRQMSVSPRRSIVIPNGADETRFEPCSAEDASTFRRRYGLGDGPLLITVGSVHERKGQDVVIRALPRVLERIPDVQYVVVGSPFRKDAFGDLARSLGVGDRVHFLGALPAADTVRALGAADLFVMASQHTPDGDFEGYGIAVVEAALCGRAAVVSDNSGVMEAIEDGDTGRVAAISDPASTADRIVELLSDRDRLARMGKRAREIALAHKTWAHRGTEYDRFLRSLLDDA